MIHVIGIGPGGSPWLTEEAKASLKEARIVYGSSRQLESVKASLETGKAVRAYSRIGEELLPMLDEGRASSGKEEQAQVVVLASGDPSLYGIGRLLRRRYGDSEVRLICGISSVQYLFAVSGQDMNDLYITSCHGRQPDFDRIFGLPKAALLTDRLTGPYQIAQEALRRGKNPRLIIGEELGCERERLTAGLASAVEDRPYKMNVVIVLNDPD